MPTKHANYICIYHIPRSTQNVYIHTICIELCNMVGNVARKVTRLYIVLFSRGSVLPSMYFIRLCFAPRIPPSPRFHLLRFDSARLGSARLDFPHSSHLILSRLASPRLTPHLAQSCVSPRLVSFRSALCLSSRGQYNLKTRVHSRRDARFVEIFEIANRKLVSSTRSSGLRKCASHLRPGIIALSYRDSPRYLGWSSIKYIWHVSVHARRRTRSTSLGIPHMYVYYRAKRKRLRKDSPAAPRMTTGARYTLTKFNDTYETVRVLSFGTGSATSVESVEKYWSAGSPEQFCLRGHENSERKS